MEKIIFLVQGSATLPYQVTFVRSGQNINASCTCPAGTNEQNCKHRINILIGDDRGIVSNNINDVKKIASWLPGSDVGVSLKSMLDAEKNFERAKIELSTAKKHLTNILHIKVSD